MKKISVAEYITEFLSQNNLNRIFAISGASNLRLLDCIHRHPKLNYICPHHEQAGIMAAMGYFRMTGQPGVMLVTAGPGGTNAITGVASAYLDSNPMIILAGQEKLEYLQKNTSLRGKGVQGLDMKEVARPITKYSTIIDDPLKVRLILEKALYEATSGRPGPVWLDIPQDIQTCMIDPQELEAFHPPQKNEATNLTAALNKTIQLLKESQRPLLWVGHGIRLGQAEQDFLKLATHLQIPILTAWNGADLLYEKHPLYVGRAGVYGQRSSNFIVQNCDLLITLGTRLAIPQIGYVQSEFARAAKKVVVEIDPAEMEKLLFQIDVPYIGNVRDFIQGLNQKLDQTPLHLEISKWMKYCRDIRQELPVVTDVERKPLPNKVNSYHFMEQFSQELPDNCRIVTDMGTSLTCTHAAIQLKQGQRLITSTGLGEMGFGLPCAIGVAIAAQEEKKPTVFIGAEGSFQMNLQEMQTVIHHKLPLKIFMLNNNAYLTIRHTETALFGPGRLSGCSTETGISFPDLEKVSVAYGFQYFEINHAEDIRPTIQKVLKTEGPVFCNVFMPEDQFLGPKTSVKTRSDGSLVSPPLEDLFPFLDRQQFQKYMLIPPIHEDPS